MKKITLDFCFKKTELLFGYKYRKTLTLMLVFLLTSMSFGQVKLYNIALNGANESPSNNSTGTGTAIITLDLTAQTMRLQCSFSGLTGNTTTCHIHAATAVADTGTAGVASQTPVFTGFPLGVTSGNYDTTFDMTLAANFNAAYVTANGGTPATAFTALATAIDQSKAYLNIHSSTFTGGEIRGFSQKVLGVNIFENENKLKVYPNPTASQFTLELKESNEAFLKIIDFNGRILSEQSINTDKSIVDISNLSKGIYFLQISTNKFTVNKKIVKE